MTTLVQFPADFGHLNEHLYCDFFKNGKKNARLGCNSVNSANKLCFQNFKCMVLFLQNLFHYTFRNKKKHLKNF